MVDTGLLRETQSARKLRAPTKLATSSWLERGGRHTRPVVRRKMRGRALYSHSTVREPKEFQIRAAKTLQLWRVSTSEAAFSLKNGIKGKSIQSPLTLLQTWKGWFSSSNFGQNILSSSRVFRLSNADPWQDEVLHCPRASCRECDLWGSNAIKWQFNFGNRTQRFVWIKTLQLNPDPLFEVFKSLWSVASWQPKIPSFFYWKNGSWSTVRAYIHGAFILCHILCPALHMCHHVWVPSQPSEVDTIVFQYYTQGEEKPEASDCPPPSLFTSTPWTLDWWETEDWRPGCLPACIYFLVGRNLHHTEAGCASSVGRLREAQKQKSSIWVVVIPQLSPPSLLLSHQTWRIE